MQFLSAYRYLLGALLATIAILVPYVRKGLYKLGSNLLSSAGWGRYMKGQGLLLNVVLVMGAIAAGGSAYLERGSTVTKGVRLIEFEKINPTEHAVYEKIDIGQYSNVTIMAETMVPENGSATVAIFSDRNDDSENRYEVKHLDSVSGSWSRWDGDNPGKHLRLVISPPNKAGVTSATELTIRA